MKAKLIASGIHLLISCAVAFLSVLLIFFVWYPAPLAKATGVTDIFLLVLMVDVVLGPLLTLIVYKKPKKTLKMDLTVIALLQVGALCYGLYTVFQGKPAWLVYNVDRFDLVRVNEIDLRHIDQAKEQYRSVPWFKPQWVGAEQPADHEQRNQVMFESVFAGVDIAQRPELYVPLTQVKEQIEHKQQSLETLMTLNDRQKVVELREAYPTAIGFVPLKGTVEDMTVLLDHNHEVIEIVDLRPWK